ncbi:LysR family transcriptional regulator [Variovorax rhizosphaerae]|uniref:LysR family transcriptional regulator n=2 Tax=Variovorax rhizosphaerae TaxID=1836200 RepID=A0ABU8WRB7_9BURK
MTLKQLEAFYWAAKLGRMSIAAPRLHVTYATLARRIADLEESVGAQLFDRSSKPADLTSTGRRLFPLAGKILDLKEQISNEVVTVPAAPKYVELR